MNSPSNSEESKGKRNREWGESKRRDPGGDRPKSSQSNEPPPEQIDQSGGIAAVGDSEPENKDSTPPSGTDSKNE